MVTLDTLLSPAAPIAAAGCDTTVHATTIDDESGGHRRLHTFSREMYERLLNHRDFYELRRSSECRAVSFVCQNEKSNVLVVGERQRDVNLASQLLCNIVMGDEEVPPKGPWDMKQQQQHRLNVSHKLSLPPPQSSSSYLGTHLPISRTVSDSYGQQQQQHRRSNNSSNKANYASSRRKLESEDSSYDSDHDQQQQHHHHHHQVSRSHDDVSRTPSETLKQEFDEWTTEGNGDRDGSSPALPYKEDFEAAFFERDPGYNAKVEYALRLGYDEALLKKALLKLGSGAEENQILEELIRLQKSKPGGGKEEYIGSNNALLSPRNSLLLEHESSKGSAEEDLLLPIVIDGSNVAMSHGNKDVFSCRGIRICVNWFQSRGHKDVKIFVPMWRKESSKPDTPITDQGILTELERERLLIFTPSRQVGGRRFVCHDDRYILNLAADTGAVVVTNDNYRDLINEKPEYKKVIEEKILMYSFVNDRFMPPDDPLGRNGPTLDQFLRRRTSSSFGSDIQPCPYGKKCTYGNKCKFFHAERGNQPQKSITDKLKETSSQKISEVRARERSRDSSPGDPLTRTKSMQPLLRPNECNLFATQQDKQTLCRTRSTFPRLSLTQGTPPEMMTVHWPPSTSSSSNSQGLQAASQSIDPSKSYSYENVSDAFVPQQQQQPWPNQFSFGLGQFVNATTALPDTSLPPPAPRSPWVKTDNEGNLHRKLARQLTLNPTYDPRIHQQQPLQVRQQQQQSYPFPPPSMVPGTAFHHATVTRNASAPEQISFHQQQPNFNFAQQQMLQPNIAVSDPETAENSHVYLHRMNSTSDSQLHKKLSDMRSLDPAMPSQSAATAVSPLIGSSDGVWEGLTSQVSAEAADFSEARSKLYYHLAAVFPEKQVLQAMQALSDETDPQKICTYILCLTSRQQQS